MLYSLFDLSENKCDYRYLLHAHLRTARLSPPADFPAPADRSDDVGVAMRILGLHGKDRAKLIYAMTRTDRDEADRADIQAILDLADAALSRADIPFPTVVRWRLSENYLADENGGPHYRSHYCQLSAETLDLVDKIYDDVIKEAQTRLVTAPLDEIAKNICNSQLVGPHLAAVAFRAFYLGLSRRAIEACLLTILNARDGERLYDLCCDKQTRRDWNLRGTELHRLLERQRRIPDSVRWGLFWWPQPYKPIPQDPSPASVFWPCKAALQHAEALPQWQIQYAKELAAIRESLKIQTEYDLKKAGFVGIQQ